MRILGIDPGSRFTGYGVIDSQAGKFKFVACGVIKPNTKETFSHRLHDIFEGVNQVIQVHSPIVAAVEDVFMKDNARSALKLGQARAAAIVAAMDNGLQVHDYSPRSIKQGVSGYGNSSKEQVQYMVRVLLQLKASPSSDATDALAVAICHANQLGVNL
ncbi:MAG: crossover junction endodeoxyribonuclease RuvC [Desulfotalea sp.]